MLLLLFSSSSAQTFSRFNDYLANALNSSFKTYITYKPSTIKEFVPFSIFFIFVLLKKTTTTKNNILKLKTEIHRKKE